MEMFYTCANISEHVNVKWFYGIPFNDSVNWRLEIAEYGQEILGENLIGMQAGNEPDLYADHGHRASTYGPYDYLGEMLDLVSAMSNDANIKDRDVLIAPNLATGDWKPEDVWNTGFVDQLGDNLAYLAVEQ